MELLFVVVCCVEIVAVLWLLFDVAIALLMFSKVNNRKCEGEEVRERDSESREREREWKNEDLKLSIYIYIFTYLDNFMSKLSNLHIYLFLFSLCFTIF